MTDGLQVLNPASQQGKIDEMTLEVVSLLEQVDLSEGELIGIVELSMLDTISNLAGYVHEMQQQILNVLGAIPDLNAPTAEDFAGQYIEDYTLLRIARTRSLLLSHVADLREEPTELDWQALDQKISDDPEAMERLGKAIQDEHDEAELPIDIIGDRIHDEAARAREDAVHDALDAERNDGG